MKLLRTDSLAATLDGVNEAFFYGTKLPVAERKRTAKWIASRQGLPGSYRQMFAPTASDMSEGIRLFTGEKNRTRAGTSHMLGQEACRALILLRAPGAEIRKALKQASGWQGWLEGTRDARSGTYCCGKCSVSMWRHMAVGGFGELDADKWFRAGMKTLKASRLDTGRWRRFPFYYTLLALTEIDLPGARKERQYAAPVCEAMLKRKPKDDHIDLRRRHLAERILVMC